MTTSAQPPMVLAQQSWSELASVLDDVELVLIPIGSTEQHGPNLGLGQDHLIAQAFCELAAERLRPRLLSAPAIPWGISDHHMNFPGSMTLRPETFLDLLEDVINSLVHHGLRRFLLVNGHGGNNALAGAAIQDFGMRLDVDFVGAVSHGMLDPEEAQASIRGDLPTGHADEFETSYSYYLDPTLVREGALVRAEMDEHFDAFRMKLADFDLEWPNPLGARTRNGALGDATRGTREAGEALIEGAIAELGEMVEFLREHAPRWNGPPNGRLRWGRRAED